MNQNGMESMFVAIAVSIVRLFLFKFAHEKILTVAVNANTPHAVKLGQRVCGFHSVRMRETTRLPFSVDRFISVSITITIAYAFHMEFCCSHKTIFRFFVFGF